MISYFLHAISKSKHFYFEILANSLSVIFHCCCFFFFLLYVPVLELKGLITSASGKGLLSLGVWKGSPCPCPCPCAWVCVCWLGVGGLQKSNEDWLWRLQPDGGPPSLSPGKHTHTHKMMTIKDVPYGVLFLLLYFIFCTTVDIYVSYGVLFTVLLCCFRFIVFAFYCFSV